MEKVKLLGMKQVKVKPQNDVSGQLTRKQNRNKKWILRFPQKQAAAHRNEIGRNEKASIKK